MRPARSMRAFHVSRAWALLLALAAACAGDPFAMEAQRLVRRTVPPDSAATLPVVVHSASGARADWTFTTKMEWANYCEWVSAHLSDYQRSSPEDDVLVFSRTVNGDVYRVRMGQARDEPGIIRVTLSARPD